MIEKIPRPQQEGMPIYKVLVLIDLLLLELNFDQNLWEPEQQSLLIESIILFIPLPAFYLDSKDDRTWTVVDGQQRLIAIYNFYKGKYSLTNLEFSEELNGLTWDQIPRSVQRKIEETELNLVIFQTGTPDGIKSRIRSLKY